MMQGEQKGGWPTDEPPTSYSFGGAVSSPGMRRAWARAKSGKEAAALSRGLRPTWVSCWLICSVSWPTQLRVGLGDNIVAHTIAVRHCQLIAAYATVSSHFLLLTDWGISLQGKLPFSSDLLLANADREIRPGQTAGCRNPNSIALRPDS